MNNNEEQKIESIWADGIPQNVSEDMKLKIEDLLLMAIDFVIKKNLIPNGFKIEQALGKIDMLPNIIAKKNDKIYSIIVLPFLFPNYGVIHNSVRIQFVQRMKELNAIPLFAPVGFASIDKERAQASLALKQDLYNTLFRGYIILNDEPEQMLLLPNDQYITNFE